MDLIINNSKIAAFPEVLLCTAARYCAMKAEARSLGVQMTALQLEALNFLLGYRGVQRKEWEVSPKLGSPGLQVHCGPGPPPNLRGEKPLVHALANIPDRCAFVLLLQFAVLTSLLRELVKVKGISRHRPVRLIESRGVVDVIPRHQSDLGTYKWTPSATQAAGLVQEAGR